MSAGGKWPLMGALRWPAEVGVKWECWMQANTEAVPERGWSSGEEWGPSHRRVGRAEQRGLGARAESECLGKAAQKLDPRAGPTGCQAVTRPWSRVRFSKMAGWREVKDVVPQSTEEQVVQTLEVRAGRTSPLLGVSSGAEPFPALGPLMGGSLGSRDLLNETPGSTVWTGGHSGRKWHQTHAGLYHPLFLLDH